MPRNKAARVNAEKTRQDTKYTENARKELSAFLIGLGDLQISEQITRIRRKNESNVFTQLNKSEEEAISKGDEVSTIAALKTFESLARSSAWIMFQREIGNGKATVAASLFRDIPLNYYEDAGTFSVTPNDLCNKVLNQVELTSLVAGMKDLGEMPQSEWSLNDDLRSKTWVIFSLNLAKVKNNSLLAQNIRNLQSFIATCDLQVIKAIVNVFGEPFNESFKKLYPQIEPKLVVLLSDFLLRNPDNARASTLLRTLQKDPQFEAVLKKQVQELLNSELTVKPIVSESSKPKKVKNPSKSGSAWRQRFIDEEE